MAELFIRNKNSWMDDVPQDVKDKWSDKMVAKYNCRKQKGDVICVRPDGFEWSVGEAPSVVKIPKLSYEDAKKYEESQTEETIVDEKTVTETIAIRRYKVIDGEIIDKVDDSKLIISTSK